MGGLKCWRKQRRYLVTYKFICFDTETTDIKDPEIIQFSGVEFSGNPINEVNRINQTIRPTRLMSPAAIAVHGITDKQATTFVKPFTGLSTVRNWLHSRSGKDFVVLGYNHINFDIPVIEECLGAVEIPNVEFDGPIIDVMVFAKKLIPISECGNYKLDTLFVTLFPDKVAELKQRRSSHDAMEDVLLTWDIFKGLCLRMAKVKGITASVNNIVKFINTPIMIEEWPFGAHKGENVEALVVRYGFHKGIVAWFLGKKDMHDAYPDLLYTLKELMR